MTDIHFVETDELLREVFDRFECVVFAGYKTSNVERGSIVTKRKTKGSAHICGGLCSLLNNMIIQKYMQNEHPSHPEER